MIDETDFTLFKDLAKTKVFTFIDTAGVATDLSGATNITLNASLDNWSTTPISIVGTVSGAGNNIVTFVFSVTDTANNGNFEYLILEDFALGSEGVISGGNINIQDKEGFSTSLDAMVTTETPAGLVISPNDKNNRIRFWRNYLQPLVTPVIADVDLEVESVWSTLANSLIAKLVIYDSLLLESKKAMIAASGGGEGAMEGGGALKKLETGPSNAEWWDASNFLSTMFKPDKDGNTPFDSLKQDLCQLAHRIRVHLPICSKLPHSPIVFQVQRRVLPDDAVTILTNLSNNRPINQG